MIQSICTHGTKCPFGMSAHNHATIADGVKIAVLRKGRASVQFIWVTAQRRKLSRQYSNECRSTKEL